MATNKLPSCKTERWTKTKLKMRLCPLSVLAVTITILVSLPYISTLTLPSGDPAPGRSPGPPQTELYPELDTVANQSEIITEYVNVTTEVTELGACAFARVPSESEKVVTVSEMDSEVNLTVSHAVFETEQLVRGVVYDVIVGGHAEYDFNVDIDDIFSSVIGPVYDVKTPHPIPNNTIIVKSTALNISALSANMVNLPAVEPRALNPRAINRNKQNVSFLRQFNVRAPMPYVKHFEHVDKKADRPKLRIDMVPQTKLQLEMLLEEPIPTIPDFNENVFELTTRRFNQIHAEHQKWMEDLPLKNNSRRQNKLSAGYSPELLRRIRMYTRSGLQKIIQKYGLPADIPDSVFRFAMFCYFKDREALKRSLALMAQFIYGAQYKFIYAQHMKERYGPKIKFRMGYSFAVMENLRLQFYSAYYVLLKFTNKHMNLEYNDEIMYLIKVYERCLGIQVEFLEVVTFTKNLNYMRLAAEAKRKDETYLKERIIN